LLCLAVLKKSAYCKSLRNKQNKVGGFCLKSRFKFFTRIASVIFAIFVIAIIIIQINISKEDSNFDTILAVDFTVYDSITADILIVRDEEPVSIGESGFVISAAKNGERVAQNQPIFYIFSSEEQSKIFNQSALLKSEIERLETLKQSSVNISAKLNGNISSTLDVYRDIQLAFSNKDYTHLSQQKINVSELLTQKNILLGQTVDFDTKISELTAQYNELNALLGAYSTKYSPYSSYYISKYTKLPTSVSYSTLKNLTVEEAKTALSENTEAPMSSSAALVKSFVWYALCVVQNTDAAQLKTGSKLTVDFSSSLAGEIKMSVEQIITENNGSSKLLLSSDIMNETVAALKKETATIKYRSYTGLYIPKSAIRFNENNEKGVYARIGNVAVFRKIKELYSNETFCLADTSSDLTDLKLYDTIIIGGKNLYDNKFL
jgi:hypothetical protein